MFDKKIDNTSNSYGDDAIVTLSPREHIRLRPGMYIGKLGDGSQADDGIYVLIKEVVDNSVDEFIMGAGKQIDVTVEDDIVTVRDYGRGIPLKSLAAAVSEMNTGGKYGGSAFKKTVGLNGVGVKAVNMLSSEFTARSVRDGEARTVTFAQGLEQSDRWESGVQEKNGTFISFRVDREVFGDYSYNLEYVEQMIRNYTYLNLGLTFRFNGQSYVSKNGLLDLLGENMTEEPLYAPIHLSGEDIEVAIAHGTGYGESYYSFVNGQYTSQGGTHQAAFREAIAKTIKEFYHKDYDPSDIRTSIIAAISVRVTDPVFESQTKIKLGSKEIEPGVPLRNFIVDFLAKHLDDYLHKHSETAQILQKKIVENEKERKAISGIQKKAREIWFLCRQYTAKEAEEMGMVNKVVPLERLEDETVEWCETILKRSPMAIRMIKRAMNAELDGQRGMMEFAGDATLMYYLMAEAQEGKNAFLEKRDPDFSQFPKFPG